MDFRPRQARGDSPVLSVVPGRMEHMFEVIDPASPADDSPAAVEVSLRSTTDWLGDAPGGLLSMAIEDRQGRLADASDDDVLRLITATERLTSWAQAVHLSAVAELARRPVMNPAGRHVLDGRSLTAAEIRTALGLTRHAAERRVDLAERLAVRLPATLAALREGRIDCQRAQTISDELAGTPQLATADRAAIEQEALARAESGATRPQLRDWIRRAVLAVAPQDAAERHEQARRERRVCTMPQPDGMGELWGYLPAETITMIDTVLNGYADTARDRRDTTDHRSHDERRADALADIFRAILDGRPLPTVPGGAWTPPPLPTRQGRRPHLVITIAASTLAGTDDQPATLAGYGPVPADLARRLAADAGSYQTACVDDTTGACQWIGKTTPYRPAQWMVDQVIARDPVCRHPGCRRPAAQCEVDHATRHPRGPTCPCNLMPLCAFHHHLKHDGGWTVEHIPTTRDTTPAGTVNWTSPLARTYPDPPIPLMPPAPRSPESQPEPAAQAIEPPF
jgi:hypothetical protein